MKIRNGFVSNSSSSSFVILGEQVKLDDIDVNDLNRKSYTYLVETGLEFEATVLAEINSPQMLDVLKKAQNGEFEKLDCDIIAYRAYKYGYEEISGLIDRDTLPKKFGVYVMTVQQGSPFNDAKELEGYYNGTY